MTDDAGQELASKYKIRAVPAFLLLSAEGEILYKKVGGMPDTDEIAALVAQLQ